MVQKNTGAPTINLPRLYVSRSKGHFKAKAMVENAHALTEEKTRTRY